MWCVISSVLSEPRDLSRQSVTDTVKVAVPQKQDRDIVTADTDKEVMI